MTTTEMRLLSGPASAFSRKVRIVIHELGLGDRIAVEVVSPQRERAALSALNPLGKIPVLESPDGALFDSSVICEYLIATFGDGRLLPPECPQRWDVLRRAALGDGILEAGMLSRGERERAASDPAALSWQIDKTQSGLDRVEALVDGFPAEPDLGCIAVGCAIGWLDFRLAALDLVGSRSKTRLWYETLAARPSFQATKPQA